MFFSVLFCTAVCTSCSKCVAFVFQAKLRTKPQVRVMAGRKPGLLRRRSTEEEDDLDGFIADGDDLSEDACDWRKELKKITGYDGSQYKDVDDADDPSMEVGWQRCLAEEQRSAKRGQFIIFPSSWKLVNRLVPIFLNLICR